MRRLLVAAVAIALPAGGCGSKTETQAPLSTQGQAPPRSSVADVVTRVLPSVVNVRTTRFDGSQAEGSGVVIDQKGIVVTNNHVVEGASSVKIVMNDGRHRQPL